MNAIQLPSGDHFGDKARVEGLPYSVLDLAGFDFKQNNIEPVQVVEAAQSVDDGFSIR